jgi:hypothetical protein
LQAIAGYCWVVGGGQSNIRQSCIFQPLLCDPVAIEQRRQPTYTVSVKAVFLGVLQKVQQLRQGCALMNECITY